MNTQSEYTITNDPIFYITVGIFALLTTGLPAILGQSGFMSVVQTLSLVVFLVLVMRKGQMKQAFRVLLIWSIIQFLCILFVTWTMTAQAEHAIPDGFGNRGAYIKWFYTGGPLPGGLLHSPLSYISEFVRISIGSLLTGGLLGVWSFVRALSLIAFQTGIVLLSLGSWTGFLNALPWWSVLRLVGYAIFLVLCSEPLLTGNWSLGYYWQTRKRPLIIGCILIAVGVLIELFISTGG